MTRAEKRQLKASEGNPERELLKIQNHFYKNLWSDFSRVKDPRHSSYIDYKNEVMLAMPLMKNICNVRSLQGMTEAFNKEECIRNIAIITGQEDLEELPHYVTENEYLSRLNPEELAKISTNIIRALIRKRSFEDA